MNLLLIIILSSASIIGLVEVVENLLKTFKGVDLFDLWKRWGQPKWLKPIIFCSTCMASFWGSVFFWTYQLALPIDFPLFMWPPSLLAIAFLNIIFAKYVN